MPGIGAGAAVGQVGAAKDIWRGKKLLGEEQRNADKANDG